MSHRVLDMSQYPLHVHTRPMRALLGACPAIRPGNMFPCVCPATNFSNYNNVNFNFCHAGSSFLVWVTMQRFQIRVTIDKVKQSRLK